MPKNNPNYSLFMFKGKTGFPRDNQMLTSIGPRPPAIGQCVKHAVKTFDGLLARYVNSINKSANIVLNPYCFDTNINH